MERVLIAEEVAVCDYCGDIDEEQNMITVKDGDKETKMCCDCAEEEYIHYADKVIPKTN